MGQPANTPPPNRREIAPAESPALLGRSGEAWIQLQDPAISRKHLLIRLSAAGWEVEDLGSRHGSKVNGASLKQGEPMPLSSGDRLTVGGWVLRAQVGKQQSRAGSTLMTEGGGGTERIRAVQEHELGGLARKRLDVLMRSAEGFTSSATLEELADSLASAASDGTGCDRAIVLLPPGDSGEVEVLGTHAGDANQTLSRSLIREAAKGNVALLLGSDMPQNIAHSLVELDIRSALCVPIEMDGSVEALLYLDARGDEKGLSQEAAAYCGALARLAGLSMSNIQRAALEKHQAALRAELDAARAAQKSIMPAMRGSVGPVRYALESEPGRVVAGDLFDVVPLDDDRTAVLLGDVTGKGVAAAMLMTSTQSYLQAALLNDPDPANAVMLTNRHLSPRVETGRFITLWLGVFDRRDRSVTFTDAGHGHWVVVRDGGTREIEAEGGLPIGLDADFVYPSERFVLEPGERLSLFSDGLVEQPAPSGEMFGLARVRELLCEVRSVKDEVRALRDAVHEFAGGAQLSDDLTIASIELI